MTRTSIGWRISIARSDGIPDGGVTILLSHTPEIYRLAAHSGIDLMLSGHTHGGQICLPGGWPIRTSTRSPRRLVRAGLAVQRHDRLYLGRGRHEHCRCAAQLPAGDHAASVAAFDMNAKATNAPCHPYTSPAWTTPALSRGTRVRVSQLGPHPRRFASRPLPQPGEVYMVTGSALVLPTRQCSPCAWCGLAGPPCHRYKRAIPI